MHTGKRILAFFLVLILVFSVLTISLAASVGCLKVKAGSTVEFETTQGAELDINLSDIFEDNNEHMLTYSLDNGDYGTQTKIANEILVFTISTVGTYTPIVTARCSGSCTAEVQLKINVKAAEQGSKEQYSYDETPADSVTVYVTVSSDGVPILASDGETVMSHLKVSVPYFDLVNHDLSDYYRYQTENGSGAYINNKIVYRPTAMHLFLYILGKYYLGYTDEEIMTGKRKIVDEYSDNDVLNMNYEPAYISDEDGDDDSQYAAITYNGGATSTYMKNFWGHDENFMYYRNHVYPLMSAGWGATSDYILLSDGDTIDVAMFTDWSFYSDGGAFAKFDNDEYIVEVGKEFTASTLKFDTKSVSAGGSEQFDSITGLDVKVYDSNWQEQGEMTLVDGNDNNYTYQFTESGTYYLMAKDKKTGVNARIAPATAIVTAYLKGDADCNGKIELDDAMLAYEYSVGNANDSLTHAGILAADMDSDGRVTAKDAAMIFASLDGES